MLEWLRTPSGAYNLVQIFAIAAWLVSGIGIIAGFHLNKIRELDARAKATQAEIERATIATKLEVSVLELDKAKAEVVTVKSHLDRITKPREISEIQEREFIKALHGCPTGEIIITYLSTEDDARMYANEFASLFQKCGFKVSVSDRIWVSLQHSGLWLCVHDESPVPAHIAPIENAFKVAKIIVKSFVGEAMHDQLSAPKESAIFVIGSRK